MFKKEMWTAIFTYLSVTIGVGIFGIPYVFMEGGFLRGVINLVLISLILIFSYLCIGEVILRTKEKHHLAGLAERYLGKKGKLIMFGSVLFLTYGALIAYCIGAGQAMQAIFGWKANLWSYVFLAVFGCMTLVKLKFFTKFESIFTPIKIIILLLIAAICIPFIKLANIDKLIINYHYLFLPYGVILFALAGIYIIPNMAWELKDKKLLKNVIVWGVISSALFALIFSFAIVGVLGKSTTQLPTVALGQQLGNYMLLLGNIFAFFAIATAFVATAYSLKDNFTLDYKINKIFAWLLVISVPLIAIITGKMSFINVMNVAGSIGMGIAICMALIIHSKARKMGNRKPEYTILNHIPIKVLIAILMIITIIFNIYKEIF